MLLITHVIIALTGLIMSGLLLANPSRTKLYLNYSLIAATLISGSCLIVITDHGMLTACVTGLSYCFITVGSSLLAARKLAVQES